jgi:hypothetical protein
MEVVKKLAAKLYVEFFTKEGYSLLDLLGLQLQILVIIIALNKHFLTPPLIFA